MAMKETYNFKSKAAARDKLKSFVKSSLNAKKRENAKVLTLLGHEETELLQVWDPIGIKRENITVVERDKKVYKILKKNDFGVKIIYSPEGIQGYLRSNKKTYDIVNLDYQGQFGIRERDDLRLIASRQQLGLEGMVATWFLGKRESGYTKEWFEEAHEQHSSDKYKSWKEGRSELISRMIVSIFMDGNTLISKHPLLRLPILEERASKMYLERLTEKEIGMMGKKGYDPKNTWAAITGLGVAKDLIEEFLREYFAHKREGFKLPKDLGNSARNTSDNGISEETINIFREILFYQNIGAYFSAHQQRFNYVGDNGAPMILDFNNFKQFDFTGLPKILETKEGLTLDLTNLLNERNLNRKIDRFFKLRYRAFGKSLSPRTHLGSSAKPVLTKQKAIEEFRAGTSINDIKDKYRGVNGKPLAAWKAHVTMGSYDELGRRDEEIVVSHKEDSDLKKITKEEAIDMISSGIPLEEIEKAYPTSFTKGQLRAYKAHITMGSYAKK